MKNMPIYEALAQAFAAEGVDTHFTLMGDGNMHWAAAMKNLDGMGSYFARHEHCACAAAMGYHLATGKVGVASVTCGPGFTQIMTALTGVARRIPLVVFAGEAPIHAEWYNQALDQPPFAAASGAHYISAHSPQRMYQYVREAFHIAREERKPVVLGVPYDLQKQPLPNVGEYQPSPRLCRMPSRSRRIPIRSSAGRKTRRAKCPIIIAGRGALRAGAQAEIEELAELSARCSRRRCWRAACSTTIRSRSASAGGFAREIARELGTAGRSGGHLRVEPQLLHCRRRPHVSEGRGGADRHRSARSRPRHEIRRSASARRRQACRRRDLESVACARARPRPASARRKWRGGSRRRRPTARNSLPSRAVLDPRRVIDELDRIIPKDWDSVSGSGHQSYFHSVMRGRKPENYHVIREFGAIGNGVPFAIGVAAARKDGKTAKGFSLRGITVTDVSQFRALFDAYQAQDTAEVWNVHISDQVMNPSTRRQLGRGHGKM